MFFPDGNFELERVETSLSISDLQNKNKMYCKNNFRFNMSKQFGNVSQTIFSWQDLTCNEPVVMN